MTPPASPLPAHLPFALEIVAGAELTLSRFDHHIVRRLSSMKGQFLDASAYQKMLAQEDVVLYEVLEVERPEHPGEFRFGLSIIHPGKVGAEYWMTKGHFHAIRDTAELYYCLRGEGMMVMETPEGEWSVEELRPGRLLYVPPRWAHRSVNTGAQEDLVTYFAYPAHAGHDYASIEKQGFRKCIVEQGGRPQIIDNPRWLPPEER